MKILTNSMKELIDVLDHFKIERNTAAWEGVPFPYQLELKQIVGIPVEDEREYTFQEFEEKYLNQKI